MKLFHIIYCFFLIGPNEISLTSILRLTFRTWWSHKGTGTYARKEMEYCNHIWLTYVHVNIHVHWFYIFRFILKEWDINMKYSEIKFQKKKDSWLVSDSVHMSKDRLSETRRSRKFGLTPLPIPRAKAHEVIQEILPYFQTLVYSVLFFVSDNRLSSGSQPFEISLDVDTDAPRPVSSFMSTESGFTKKASTLQREANKSSSLTRVSKEMVHPPEGSQLGLLTH